MNTKTARQDLATITSQATLFRTFPLWCLNTARRVPDLMHKTLSPAEPPLVLNLVQW